MDANQVLTLRYAESMRVFADGDPTFIFGQWRAWKAACERGGRMIPPAEFKGAQGVLAGS